LGFDIYGQAKSAVHEIEALAAFIIAAVLPAGAVVADCITSLRKDLWAYRVAPGRSSSIERIQAEAPTSDDSPAPIESLLTSVSGLPNRVQTRPAPKSAKEQLEELRAKEKENERTKDGDASSPA
jgi:hypothetical protein